MEDIDTNVERVLKKAPQFTRLRRHLISLISHSTPRKLWNLFVVELERQLRRRKVKGHPYILIFDPGNVCNLRCPLCPTGQNILKRERKFVNFADFKKVFDYLSPYLYEVILHNWGEPFLNPDILRMVHYCADRNIGTSLSTNFSMPLLDMERVVLSGLEYLIVSLDGTTQDVYSKYRIGGDINMVFENIRALIDTRRKLKSKIPFIEWQYIAMKHNCHQIDDAKRMAKEIGVDTLRFISAGLPLDAKNKRELAQEWFPYLPDGNSYRDDAFLQEPIKGGCFYLYRAMTVNPGGGVAPCCAVYNEEDDFGNILDTDFSNIWNNEFYKNARALFSKRKKPTIKTVCSRCTMFSKNTSQL